MRWNKDKYQITAPLDNRKHRNVGVVRSSPGITKYITACQTIDSYNCERGCENIGKNIIKKTFK